MYEHQLQPEINRDGISLIRLLLEHFQEAKVKFCLRFDRTNERMFVLRMGSYTEEISSWLPLIWPFLSRSVFNRPRSESLCLLSLSVNLTQSWKKNLRGNCVLIVNSTGLKFSYSTLPQSCFFWDYYISKSLTLFTASEIIYVSPLRSNKIPFLAIVL